MKTDNPFCQLKSLLSHPQGWKIPYSPSPRSLGMFYEIRNRSLFKYHANTRTFIYEKLSFIDEKQVNDCAHMSEHADEGMIFSFLHICPFLSNEVY